MSILSREMRMREMHMREKMARAANRPDLIRRDEGVLFHNTGSTGWRRRRDLGDYMKGRSEHNFADQHDRFFDPAVDTLE